MNPLQWMGAVRMRVQTADKYTPHHQTVFFQLKYESSFHNIACNKSGEKYPQIKHCLQAKMVQQFWTNIPVNLIWEVMDFFTGGSVIIMEPCTFWPEATVKSWKPWWWIFVLQTQSFSFDYVLTDGLGYLWIIVMFLISCLDSHSDGTHSLQRIHWWKSDVMLHFSKYVLMKKQTHLHLGSPEGKYIFSKFSFLDELFL